MWGNIHMHFYFIFRVVNVESKVKYVVFDIESIPDASLIKQVKYPHLPISEHDAVIKFQEEILNVSDGSTWFIPVTFQLPVIVTMLEIDEKFFPLRMRTLDEPQFRVEQVVRQFWDVIEGEYNDASFVTFNGRGFDFPLMELMAFRFGATAKRHFKDKFASRFRFGTKHIDLHDWLSNYSAIKMQGGLNLLAKVIGKPGKVEMTGDDVYDLYKAGKISEIHEYCVSDVLDTYFVFLRTRVMVGELSSEREDAIVQQTRVFLEQNKSSCKGFEQYLKNWNSISSNYLV